MFSIGLIGVCCPTLRITATGPAKTKQSNRLGTYEYYKLGPDGREIFKQTPKVSEQEYLYFAENDGWFDFDEGGHWMVSHNISNEAIKRGFYQL